MSCVCVFATFAVERPQATRAEGTSCASQAVGSCLNDVSVPQFAVPAGITVAAPIHVTPLDAGLEASTSLANWRSYNADQLSRKVELSAGQGALATVRTATVPLPIDVWTRVQMIGLSGDADRDVRIAAGADYRLGQVGTLGVFAGSSGSVPDAAAQDTVGAYANMMLLPSLSVEAKGQWAVASLGGGAGAGSQAAMSIAPRVSQKYMLEGGRSIEPFVTLRNDLLAEGDAAFVPSAGGGVVLDKQQSYSLSISTMVDSIEEPDRANVNSRIQLKIPIP